jgi:hypothetical protein
VNAADEIAVAAFLEGRISFTGIPRLIKRHWMQGTCTLLMMTRKPLTGFWVRIRGRVHSPEIGLRNSLNNRLKISMHVLISLQLE